MPLANFFSFFPHSDPELAPCLLRSLVAFKAEIDVDNVLESFRGLGGPEATGEIAECDAREECA